MSEPRKARKPDLLLDVDGVLVDTDRFVLRSLGLPEDTRLGDYSYSMSLGVPDPDIMAAVSERLLVDRPEPYPGAVDFVQWCKERYNVYAVTAPWYGVRGWTEDRSLALSGTFGICKSMQVHTSAKHLVAGDVFVDDKPGNVSSWKDANPCGWSYLFCRPHNIGVYSNEKVYGYVDLMDRLS